MTSRIQFPPISSLFSQAPILPLEPMIFIRPPVDFELPPGIIVVRGAWNFQEDALLRNAVNRFGTEQWDIVATEIPGRSATQCRERWLFRISPGLNKNPFEKWEDELIIRERETLGNHWTLIASHLPGRTSCAVKNRWYSVLRKHSHKWTAAVEHEAFRFETLLSYPVPTIGEI
jgi:hypothetical protein